MRAPWPFPSPYATGFLLGAHPLALGRDLCFFGPRFLLPGLGLRLARLLLALSDDPVDELCQLLDGNAVLSGALWEPEHALTFGLARQPLHFDLQPSGLFLVGRFPAGRPASAICRRTRSTSDSTSADGGTTLRFVIEFVPLGFRWRGSLRELFRQKQESPRPSRGDFRFRQRPLACAAPPTVSADAR